MAQTETTAAPRYRVTAPYVNVKTGALAGIIAGRSGMTVVGLYRGALLPADTPVEQVAGLLERGYVEEAPSDA